MMSGRYILKVLAAAALPLCLLSCKDEGGERALLPIAQKALTDTASVYYTDLSSYPEDISKLPIGVLDCSVNGFEVVERLLTLDRFDNITGKPSPDGIVDFGGENIQFLSDRANGPYGGYIEEGNLDFLKEQVLSNTLFLMGDDFFNLAGDEYRSGYKEPVKLIIVSSPVADLRVLPDVENFLEQSGTGVKAIGVVEAGVQEAVSDVDEDGNLCVGVLFAPDGVSSIEYESMIRKTVGNTGGKVQVLNQEAVGLDAAIKGDTAYVDTSAVVARGSYAGPVSGVSYNNIDMSLFDRYGFDTRGNALLYPGKGDISGVQLNSVENYVRFHLVSMIERHRRSGSRVPISSIILADGSYAQVRGVLEEVMDELYNYRRGGIYLYRSGISPDFRFIDPAECAAVEAYKILRNDRNLALRGDMTRLESFISLPSASLPEDVLNPDGTMKDGFKYGRQCGSEELTTKVVPFAPRYVSPEIMNYIERNNSEVYSLIRNYLY